MCIRKRTLMVWGIALVAVALLAGAGGLRDAATPAAAQADPAEISQQWSDAYNRGDVDALMEFYTDDAVGEASQRVTPPHVPGEVLVKFRTRIPQPARSSAFASLPGGRELQWNSTLRLARVEVAAGTTVEEAASVYSKLPDVERAQPNYIYRGGDEPDDPLFGRFQNWYYHAVNAPAGWGVRTSAADIVIAIVDTGIDLDHPELAPMLYANSGETPGDLIDNDGNGCVDDVYGCNYFSTPDPDGDVDDNHGHGSMVAGTACAASNNSSGIAAVAWNCKLIAAKALDSSNAGNTFTVSSGIEYAASRGADVINVSIFFGCGFSDTEVEETIEMAHAAGAVIVSIAGNDGVGCVMFPGSHPDTIAVGAVGFEGDGNQASSDTRWEDSNWGPEVDVVAPGWAIVSTNTAGLLRQCQLAFLRERNVCFRRGHIVCGADGVGPSCAPASRGP